MKPTIHAENNVKKYGGKIEDYLPIHQFMDSSKGAMCDVRHRALTHTSWFIQPDGILEKVFGVTFVNSDGKTIAVRDIGEDHILEDFDGFIPTPQDFLKDIPVKPWMHRGGGTPNDPVTLPPSTVVVKVPEEYRDIKIPVDPIKYWPPIPRESPPFIPNRWPTPGGIEVRDFVVSVPYCKTVELGVEKTEKLSDAFAGTVKQNQRMDYSNSMRVPNQQYGTIDNPTVLYDSQNKEPAAQVWQDENGIAVLDLKLVDKFGESDETKENNMNVPFCQKYEGFIFNVGLNVSC